MKKERRARVSRRWFWSEQGSMQNNKEMLFSILNFRVGGDKAEARREC